MSPYSAFICNILTMGFISPWTYIWAPGALPGGASLGDLFAMLLEIPIARPMSGWPRRCRGGAATTCFKAACSGAASGSRSCRRLRGVDPAVGGAVGMAALLPRLRVHVPRTGGDHDNPSFTAIGAWSATPSGIIIVSV